MLSLAVTLQSSILIPKAMALFKILLYLLFLNPPDNGSQKKILLLYLHMSFFFKSTMILLRMVMHMETYSTLTHVIICKHTRTHAHTHSLTPVSTILLLQTSLCIWPKAISHQKSDLKTSSLLPGFSQLPKMCSWEQEFQNISTGLREPWGEEGAG